MEHNRRTGGHEMVPRREPQQRKSTKRTGHKVAFILGTVLLVGICTVAMLAGLFMMYVRTTLAPTLEVNADDYTMNLSSIIYYQDKGPYMEGLLVMAMRHAHSATSSSDTSLPK